MKAIEAAQDSIPIEGYGYEPDPTHSKCTVIILGHNLLFDVLLKDYLEKHSNIRATIVNGSDDRLPNLSVLRGGDRDIVELIDASNKTWLELSGFLNNRLTRFNASAKVVLFNVEPDSDVQPLALQWGVRGLIFSSTPPEMVVKAIQCVINGQIWAPRKELEKCIQNSVGTPMTLHNLAHAAKSVLSQRETEVLSFMTAGQSNKSIAERLYVSENTVKSHISNIFKKIGVSNRFQAALWVAKMVNKAI